MPYTTFNHDFGLDRSTWPPPGENVLVIYRSIGKTAFSKPVLMTFYVTGEGRHDWEFSAGSWSIKGASERDRTFDLRWHLLPEPPAEPEPHRGPGTSVPPVQPVPPVQTTKVQGTDEYHGIIHGLKALSHDHALSEHESPESHSSHSPRRYGEDE